MQRHWKRVERKFTFNFPSAACLIAKTLQASEKKVYFQFPERSLFSAKIRINTNLTITENRENAS